MIFNSYSCHQEKDFTQKKRDFSEFNNSIEFEEQKLPLIKQGLGINSTNDISETENIVKKKCEFEVSLKRDEDPDSLSDSSFEDNYVELSVSSEENNEVIDLVIEDINCKLEKAENDEEDNYNIDALIEDEANSLTINNSQVKSQKLKKKIKQEKGRDYYQLNKKKWKHAYDISDKKKNYNKSNRDKVNAYSKSYYQLNKAKQRDYAKENYRLHKIECEKDTTKRLTRTLDQNYFKKYYLQNKEGIQNNTRKWNKVNYEKLKEKNEQKKQQRAADRKLKRDGDGYVHITANVKNVKNVQINEIGRLQSQTGLSINIFFYTLIMNQFLPL